MSNSELQLGQMRIPDILETIADLSNDEVFTPPQLANKVLDMLPEDVWSNSKITFLDPACKTGVFLREISKRLIVGLEEEIPDLQERVNHILTKQVYGLGITELTTLMSRRTVYCATKANSESSVVTAFDNEEGNIKFPKSKHSFHEKTKKCTICGAGEDLYGEVEGMDNYAYSFLHDNLKEVFGDVKFDVIIGNPPYQLEDGGAGTSAKPIYNLFVEKAIELEAKYVSMIIPSRWMNGGKGLQSFRETIINSNKVKIMYDFQNPMECFKSVKVDGGVCYFLYDKKHNGKTKYIFKDLRGNTHNSERFLKNNFTDGVIRDNRQESIIKKVLNSSKNMFSEIVSSRNPFGLNTDLFNVPDKYKNVIISNKKTEVSNVKVYGFSDGKRVEKYVNRTSVLRGEESINKYKIFFSKAYSTDATIPPKAVEAYPGSASTDTFLKIGDFKSKEEMINCSNFIETKFFRGLLFFNRHSLSVSKSTFDLIPLLDFKKSYSDEELYKRYKLSSSEISYIEDIFKNNSIAQDVENNEK